MLFRSVLELSALERGKYVPLAELVRYAVGTRRTVTDALIAAIGTSVGAYLGIGLALLPWWWVSFLLGLATMGTVALLQGMAGAIGAISIVRTAVKGLVLIICGVVGIVTIIKQFRTQLRIRTTLRDGFAQRRMANSDLAALIRQTESGEAIIASLLTPALNPRPS